MIRMECPDDDCETTYRLQAVRTRDKALRIQLLSQSASVAARGSKYLESAAAEELYQFAPSALGGIGTAMAEIYTRVLVKGGGRHIYERIKGSAKFSRCPLCGQRDVKTLDHYMPKEKYPEFAVFPANLVPCCSDCNKTKGEYVPASHKDQVFHPYFDDWGQSRILFSDVQVTDRVNVLFKIGSVQGVPAATLDRAKTHFDLLHLGELYAAGAAVELVESKATFRRSFSAGSEALRDDLLHTAQSRQAENLNSWRAALYWGLAASEPFCNGGFEKIEE